MKKLYFPIGIIILTIIAFSFFQSKETSSIRQRHEEFLKNSPFKNTLNLSKNERKKLGLPPNKYSEREWELTMSPFTGKPTPENLIEIQQNINSGKYAYISNIKMVPGDFNNQWEERGPNNIGGRVKAVLFDPNDSNDETVFAGGVSGGLWRNSNISSFSSSWELIETTANISVTSLTTDPNNPQIFYLGSGESYTYGQGIGNGVWKSEDGGDTWVKIFGGVDGEVEYQSDALLTINSPNTIAGDENAVAAGFGPDLTNITGDLALVDDGDSNNPEEGCTTLINPSEIDGKIAVIKRGECVFIDKVKYAQEAGAIAVLMINNVGGLPIKMAGEDLSNEIQIPSLMITKEAGDNIINALSSNVINVTIKPQESLGASLFLVPGKSHINNVLAVDNNGTTEVYATVGDSQYVDSSYPTLYGSDDVGIYKSIDGGQNWVKMTLPILSEDEFYVPNDLEYSSDNTLWLSTTNSPLTGKGGGAILSCTDGMNFNLEHSILNGQRTEIAVSKQNPNKIYAACSMSNEDADRVKVLKTSDGFSTVTDLNLPVDHSFVPDDDFTNGQSFYDLAIEVDKSNDNTVFVGGIGWFKSTNSGSNWSQIATGYLGGNGKLIHPDQHGIIQGNSSNNIIAGNDGGVVYSSQDGANFSHRTKNLNITQFYNMAVAPTSSFSEEYFIAGAQDNGTQLFSKAIQGINGSTEALDGDGGYAFFDQDGTDKYYIANYVYNNYIELFNYNTGTKIVINEENFNSGDFINQEELDSNLNILYSNYSSNSDYKIKRYAIKSLEGSGDISKTTLKHQKFDSRPTALKVSPYTTTSSNLFVGLQNGKILKVTKANSFSSWSIISPENMFGSVSDIEFGDSEDKIFITMHNYSVNNIWYTEDGGANWEQKDGNLPDMPVKCILQNPLNTEQVIIGTELGTWWTEDFSSSSPTWYHGAFGMNSVKVTDLVMRDDYKVYAATYGRGVFSSQFTSADGTTSIEDEAINKNLSIYPNPVSDILSLRSVDVLNKPTVQIYDTNGRLILKKSFDQSTVNVQMNVSTLATGYYILKLEANGNTYVKKLIKQ